MSATMPAPVPESPRQCRCEPIRQHDDYSRPAEYMHAAGCPVADREAGLLAEQRHQYRDLDADSVCCLPGLSCPACPPRAAS